MNISAALKKIYHWLDRKDADKLLIPIKSQLDFLNKQKNPNDDYDRAYLQYKCQMFMMSTPIRVISNLGSAFAIIPFIIYLRLRYHNINNEKKVDAVFVENGMDMGIIPDSITKLYKQFQVCSFTETGCLGSKECKLLRKSMSKHPLSPYMNMKVAMKVALYCGIIKKYQPKAIISYCETSFASALTTMYCEVQNIKHINVQHGDFLKNIKFSGFRFSTFYVWDEHYAKMFRDLGNTSTPYIIETCKNLTRVLSNQEQQNKTFEYDITYYLGDERYKQMEIVASELQLLSKMGYKCKIRLHPRETSESEAMELFNGAIQIEKPREISLSESLRTTKYVCSQYSTVLLQAYFCKKKIIIDDCTDKASFEKLKEVDYILLNVQHDLLSQLIRDGN